MLNLHFRMSFDCCSRVWLYEVSVLFTRPDIFCKEETIYYLIFICMQNNWLPLTYFEKCVFSVFSELCLPDAIIFAIQCILLCVFFLFGGHEREMNAVKTIICSETVPTNFIHYFGIKKLMLLFDFWFSPWAPLFLVSFFQICFKFFFDSFMDNTSWGADRSLEWMRENSMLVKVIQMIKTHVTYFLNGVIARFNAIDAWNHHVHLWIGCFERPFTLFTNIQCSVGSGCWSIPWIHDPNLQ